MEQVVDCPMRVMRKVISELIGGHLLGSRKFLGITTVLFLAALTLERAFQKAVFLA